jgi:hypothetical protein
LAVDVSWLTKRVTAEELRADRDGGAFWKRLLDAYRDRDELWEFSSPAHYWQNLAGCGGVALVRDGAVVDSVVSVMN